MNLRPLLGNAAFRKARQRLAIVRTEVVITGGKDREVESERELIEGGVAMQPFAVNLSARVPEGEERRAEWLGHATTETVVLDSDDLVDLDSEKRYTVVSAKHFGSHQELLLREL